MAVGRADGGGQKQPGSGAAKVRRRRRAQRPAVAGQGGQGHYTLSHAQRGLAPPDAIHHAGTDAARRPSRLSGTGLSLARRWSLIHGLPAYSHHLAVPARRVHHTPWVQVTYYTCTGLGADQALPHSGGSMFDKPQKSPLRPHTQGMPAREFFVRSWVLWATRLLLEDSHATALAASRQGFVR